MRRFVPRILVIIVTSFLLAINSLFVVITPFADVITPVAYAGDGIIIDNAAHVCVRPPDVPADYAAWSYSHDKPGRTVTHNASEFRRWALAEVVYVYDPNAPPESARLLPMKYQPIVCPNRPKPKPITKPPPPPKKEEIPEEKKPETKGEKVTPKTGVSQAAPPVAPPQAKPEEPAPLPMRIGTPLSQYEYNMRKDADQKLLAQNPENVLIETDSVLPRLTTADGPHPLVSVVPCQETKEGCKKGDGAGPGAGAGAGAQAQTGAETVSAEDETALDALAESLAIAGAMATLQMNENLKRPDGKRYGIVGGKDPKGINNPVVQAIAGTLLISAAIVGDPIKLARQIKEASRKGLRIIITTVDEKGLKLAEKLAAKHGLHIADAMNKIGMIAPYNFMQIFTKGMKNRVHAHHILEVHWAKKFGLGNTDFMPSVILPEAEHIALTKKLKDAAKAKGVKAAEDLWEVYNDVYNNQPAWLNAIKSYFGK